MSRSGYTDDGWDDESAQWASIRYAGALKSAMRGKRGQAFLKELLAALDAMPVKRLIREHLEIDGDQDWYTGSAYDGVHLPTVIVGADELCARDGTVAAMGDVCALGALGRVRGLDMSTLDPEDAEGVAAAFSANEKIIRDIVYHNDEFFDYAYEAGVRRIITPEERWQKMRDRIASLITSETSVSPGGTKDAG